MPQSWDDQRRGFAGLANMLSNAIASELFISLFRWATLLSHSANEQDSKKLAKSQETTWKCIATGHFFLEGAKRSSKLHVCVCARVVSCIG